MKYCRFYLFTVSYDILYWMYSYLYRYSCDTCSNPKGQINQTKELTPLPCHVCDESQGHPLCCLDPTGLLITEI